MFTAELKKFTSYSKMVKAIQNALPTTIYDNLISVIMFYY